MLLHIGFIQDLIQNLIILPELRTSANSYGRAIHNWPTYLNSCNNKDALYCTSPVSSYIYNIEHSSATPALLTTHSIPHHTHHISMSCSKCARKISRKKEFFLFFF